MPIYSLGKRSRNGYLAVLVPYQYRAETTQLPPAPGPQLAPHNPPSPDTDCAPLIPFDIGFCVSGSPLSMDAPVPHTRPAAVRCALLLARLNRAGRLNDLMLLDLSWSRLPWPFWWVAKAWA